MPAVLLALDAELVARSTQRRATDRRRRLLQGAFETASRRDELLTEIRASAGPRGDAGSAYRKLAPAGVGLLDRRRRGRGRRADRRHDHDGRDRRHRASATIAYRATAVESALIGTDGRAAAIAAAAAHADGRPDGRRRHPRRRDVPGGRWPRSYARRAIEAALAPLG